MIPVPLTLPADTEEMLTPPADSIYEVECISCGWIGMNDECKHKECPDCQHRVSKRKEK